jgi:hypothetical protein
MEIKRNRNILSRRIQLCLLLLLLMTAVPIFAWSQNKPVKNYTIRNGNMVIRLGKNLKSSALDSFIVQFNLVDLDLKEALRSNRFKALLQSGWTITLNNNKILVISKPLEALKSLNNPVEEIVIAEKHPSLSERFPSVSEKVLYGWNHFINKFPFAVKDSVVTFFLKNHLRQNRAYLAGSFNNWEPQALAMTRTDSGWIALVKLTPGKYWYKFIIDGRWAIDDDNRLKEEDGYGNTNSVFYQTNMILRLNEYPDARSVFLTGSFNDWRKDELEMQHAGTGWAISLYLAQGTHSYKFIVDGKEIPDPKNPLRLPDSKKGYNSVIQLGYPQTFSLAGYTAAKKVVLTGSFNHWRTDELMMNKTSAGWKLAYTTGPGNYEYNFIVDDKWLTDPGNPLTLTDKKNQPHSYLIVSPNYTFVLKGFEHAKNVFLAGDFNDWNPILFPMKKKGDDWVFPVHLSVGKHVYKFIVDGQWMKDPVNRLWEGPDQNSILWIDRPPVSLPAAPRAVPAPPSVN